MIPELFLESSDDQSGVPNMARSEALMASVTAKRSATGTTAIETHRPDRSGAAMPTSRHHVEIGLGVLHH